MRRISTVVVAVLVLVGTVAAVPAAGLVQSSDDGATGAQTANESNASVAPGERLSGVVGVGEAELEGEVESRAFGLAVARADSDEARAELIAQKVNESRERVENLSEQREQLREARENGSISQGEYAARIAELAARSDNVQRTANDTANASEGLPAELLESKGVNASAIQQLRDNARNLTGQEVAEIARNIAGERSERADRGGDRGADRGGERDRDARDGGDATPTDDGMEGERTGDGERTTDDGTNGQERTDNQQTTDGEQTDDDTDTDAGGNRGGGSDRGGR